MTPANSQPSIDSARAPAGFLEPSQERARRAFTAMKDQRLDDAARHLDALAGDSESATSWHSFLKGALAAHRYEFNEALVALETAASASDGSRDGARLAAMAWERVGLLHRRREELGRAANAHEQAYKLREQHGSPVERWESAHSRAVTAALGGQADEAVKWFQMALTAADGIADHAAGHGDHPENSPDRCRAETYASLADALTAAARGEEAVAAARSAQACWQGVDLGSVEAARAEARLGRTLVSHAEFVLDVAPETASSALDEAIARLTSTRESLLAFGTIAKADVVWCGDLLDFARRLRAAF